MGNSYHASVKRTLLTRSCLLLRRRTRRVALCLFIGAVFAMASAWTMSWLASANPNWWASRDDLGSNRLIHEINHWTWQTPSSVLQGEWVPNISASVRTENRRSLVSIGKLMFFRSVTFATAEQIEAERKSKSTRRAGDLVDYNYFVTARYSETEHVYGFPIPCVSVLTTYDLINLPNGTSSWDNVSRRLEWLERGIEVAARTSQDTLSSPYSGSRAYLPLTPWLIGFIPNTLFWASVTWLVVGGLSRSRRRRRLRAGLCPACSYPRGRGARCSECGTAMGSRAA